MHRRTPLRMGPLRFRDPVLLCGVLYGLLLFDASGFLRTGLLAAFLHEWGHILVYCAQQRRFPVIEVTLTGFCMRLGRAELSPAQRFRLAAAGPAVNFALAGVWAVLLSRQATVRGSAFWAANLLTGRSTSCRCRRWTGPRCWPARRSCGHRRNLPETIAKICTFG